MTTDAAPAAPSVDVSNLAVHFRRRGGLRGRGVRVPAVRDVSFALWPGTTLGLAGESGSGKSTVARTLLRLNKPTSGSVHVDGRELTSLRGPALKAYRRMMQMVFQDPYDSLDPRMRIGATIGEALAVRGVPAARREAGVRDLLDRVGLPAAHADRHPHELSGGQRQRVSIARALGVEPSLIVCDEAVSALDVSVRAQVLNLLKDLQDEMDLAYLFISHDLSTLRFIADRIAIMYLGRIVEIGDRDAVLRRPQHPYTQALVTAIPEPVARRQRAGPRVRLAGEPPSPTAPPSGCPFHPRCPLAEDICRRERPALRVTATGQAAACHFAPPADGQVPA